MASNVTLLAKIPQWTVVAGTQPVRCPEGRLPGVGRLEGRLRGITPTDTPPPDRYYAQLSGTQVGLGRGGEHGLALLRGEQPAGHPGAGGLLDGTHELAPGRERRVVPHHVEEGQAVGARHIRHPAVDLTEH